MANDVSTFTMQIEGSVLHVTGCFALVTAHKKPMLGDVLMMMMQLVLIMLNMASIEETGGSFKQESRGDQMLPW